MRTQGLVSPTPPAATVPAKPPTELQSAAGERKYAALRTITSHGCASCAGATAGTLNGHEIICPFLADDERGARLSPSGREKAEACAVPALFASVYAGTEAPESVTAERVEALRPFYLGREGATGFVAYGENLLRRG